MAVLCIDYYSFAGLADIGFDFEFASFVVIATLDTDYSYPVAVDCLDSGSVVDHC